MPVFEAELAQLQAALTSRIVVEQAKGTLSVSHGVALDEALAMLRRHARHQQRDIHDVADEVVRNGGEFLGLAPKSKTALVDDLHRLLMRAADTAEELAQLAANPALVQLKTGLADAFVWLSAAVRGMCSNWLEDRGAIRYQGAGTAGCGYNAEIDCGYKFAFRDPATDRVATVLVEAAAGAGAALTEDAARSALGRYLTDETLPMRIVLGRTAASGAPKTARRPSLAPQPGWRETPFFDLDPVDIGIDRAALCAGCVYALAEQRPLPTAAGSLFSLDAASCNGACAGPSAGK